MAGDLHDYRVTVTERGFVVEGRVSSSDARAVTVATRDGKGAHDYRAQKIGFPECWSALTPEQRQEIAAVVAPLVLAAVMGRVDASSDGGVVIRDRVTPTAVVSEGGR